MTLTCVQGKTGMFVCCRVCVCVWRAKERGVQYEKSGAGQQSNGFGSSLTAVKDETWFHMC